MIDSPFGFPTKQNAAGSSTFRGVRYNKVSLLTAHPVGGLGSGECYHSLAGAVFYFLASLRFKMGRPSIIAFRVISESVNPVLAARLRSSALVTSDTRAVAIALLAFGFLGLLM